MDFFKSFKENSSSIFSAYKNEFSNFVSSLSTEVDTIIKPKQPTSDTKEQSIALLELQQMKLSSNHDTQEPSILLELVKQYLPEALYAQLNTNIDLFTEVIKIINSNDKAMIKDPNELVLLQRSDFTNFHVFYEQVKNESNFIKQLLKFDPNLENEFINEDTQEVEKEDLKKGLARYLYRIIYETLTYDFEELINSNAHIEQMSLQLNKDIQEKQQQNNQEQKILKDEQQTQDLDFAEYVEPKQNIEEQKTEQLENTNSQIKKEENQVKPEEETKNQENENDFLEIEEKYFEF